MRRLELPVHLVDEVVELVLDQVRIRRRAAARASCRSLDTKVLRPPHATLKVRARAYRARDGGLIVSRIEDDNTARFMVLEWLVEYMFGIFAALTSEPHAAELFESVRSFRVTLPAGERWPNAEQREYIETTVRKLAEAYAQRIEYHASEMRQMKPWAAPGTAPEGSIDPGASAG